MLRLAPPWRTQLPWGGNRFPTRIPIMSKTIIAGLGSCIIGLLVLAFQAIQTLMNPDAASIKGESVEWEKMTLVTILPEGKLDWVSDISIGILARIADTIVNMQFWLLMLIFGVILLIIGGLTAKN
jgi:hypothetical protein